MTEDEPARGMRRRVGWAAFVYLAVVLVVEQRVFGLDVAELLWKLVHAAVMAYFLGWLFTRGRRRGQGGQPAMSAEGPRLYLAALLAASAAAVACLVSWVVLVALDVPDRLLLSAIAVIGVAVGVLVGRLASRRLASNSVHRGGGAVGDHPSPDAS